MVTFDILNQRILRLIGDSTGRKSSTSLLYDAVCNAHEAILPWVPKMAVVTLTSGSGGTNYSLPADLYQIQAVQRIEDNQFVPKATMAPQTVRNSLSTVSIDWIEYPTGVLSFSADVSAYTFKVYYLSHWNVPVSETDLTFQIEVPVHAHAGLVYYAASQCLVPQAVNSASIRQFNLRVDSGTPEDNPVKVEADYLLQRFIQEMKLMPPYTKVGL